MQITVGDFLHPRALPQGQFKSVWEQLGSQGVEAQKKMSLSFKSLEAAVDPLVA